MKRFLQTIAVSALLIGPSSVAQAQINFGIRIGQMPAARAYRVPRQPSPEHVWIEGYWYPQAGRYVWHDGYWTRPPYQDAYWVEPYYVGGQYYAGAWESGRGRNISHDHRWDRSRQRDERRSPRGNDDSNNGRNNGRDDRR